MRKQDHLPELIRSLSPNEKRYFNLFADLQTGPKGYIKLYELLQTESSYNADQLCKKLKLTKQQLADAKQYLQLILLRALRNFDQDNNPKIEMMNRYHEADLLSRRGMSEFALSHLDKVYEKMREYECFGLFLDSFLLRLTLIQNREDGHAEFVSQELLKQHMAQINEVFELEFFYHQVIPHLVNRRDNEPFVSFSKHELMQKKPDDLLSGWAKICWYNMKIPIVVFSDYLGAEAVAYSKEAIEVFEKNPILKLTRLSMYITSYSRLASSYRYEEAPEAAKALDKALSLLHENEARLHYRSRSTIHFHLLLQKMVLLNSVGRYKEVIEIGPVILDLPLPSNREYLKQTIFCFYSLALLLDGQVDKASTVLNEIYKFKGDEAATYNIMLYAMMLELMIQYDLGNYSVISYKAKSLEKWVKRKKVTFDIHKPFLKWMIRIGAAAESVRIKQELKAFRDDAESGKLKLNMTEFNVQYWLERKLDRLK